MIFNFLQFLNNKSIDYAIVNGYKDFFSDSLGQKDVDILFKEKDFKIIEDLVKEYCSKEGCCIVQNYHQEVYAKNIFIYNPKTNEFLNLDVYGQLHFRNYIYFSEADIFNNRQEYKNIKILCKHQEFLHYFLKKLGKKDLSLFTFNYLIQLYENDKTKCNKLLYKHFEKTGNQIISAFTTNDYHLLINLLPSILFDVKKGRTSLLQKAKNIARIIKRIFKPTGISVAFLGPDGSGKTTIINGLKKAGLPFRRIDYFHLKPLYFKKNKHGITTDPHKFKPYNSLKSYIKILYLFFQYNIGWLKNVLPLKVKSSLIIFDRYFDDLIADNKRYRYGGKRIIAEFMRFFINKPSLYFVLVADPEIIYKRKQEVAFSELQSQINKYRSLADNKRYFEINVDAEPNLIVSCITQILMKKLNGRY